MDMFDDSELAAAAYNAGQNKVKNGLITGRYPVMARCRTIFPMKRREIT